ncbi:MAG: cytochrome c peroxidase [Fuerstiella sp.]|nr:cytochrome c peroxidase [Fuerstiella sp.]
MSMQFVFSITIITFVVVAGCTSEKPAPDQTATEGSVEHSDTGDTSTNEESLNSDQVERVADAPKPTRVLLGSTDLTAGIPGEGPLTTEQIQAWVDDPQNHVSLEVELPLGLLAGAGLIKIPADNPMTRAGIELGRQLFFDKRLSSDNTVSCADCHHPAEGYTRHTQFGVGVNGQEGGRNSPVSYNRIFSGAQFWDGRAASLEEQAVGPIANPIEMANTHEAAVETVRNIEGYSIQFEKVFEDGVTIDNIGKAIATFERAIVTGAAPVDYYEPVRIMHVAFGEDLEDLDALKEDDPDLYEDYMARKKVSDEHPISESAIRGRELFFTARAGCTACHVGANFADEKYHNLGIGMGHEKPDLGRFTVTGDEKDRGAFKTPTIRNVALTAPYMHDGTVKTLEDVVEWYAKGGHPNPQLSKDVKKLELSDQDKKDLVEFMKACTGEFPEVETERLPDK